MHDDNHNNFMPDLCNKNKQTNKQTNKKQVTDLFLFSAQAFSATIPAYNTSSLPYIPLKQEQKYDLLIFLREQIQLMLVKCFL